MTFIEKLEKRWDEKKFICIGLDPETTKLPEAVRRSAKGVEDSLVAFNMAIIEVTASYASAFKANSAFYEAYGEDGMRALKRTSAYLADAHPEIPTILDAKRADVAHTTERYATAIFDELGFDAVTVNPYLGREALKPFLDRADRGVFVIVKTSNPGSGEFQDLDVDGNKLYERVARAVANEWNQGGNCGVVAGATHPTELARVRSLVGDIPILVPGIGAQGGSASESFRAAKNKQGTGVLIAASRSILYASSGPDYAEAAEKAAQKIAGDISL